MNEKVESKNDLSISTEGNTRIVDIWTKEIENSLNYQKEWTKEAEDYYSVYENGDFNIECNRYNVFWANTQTLRPLLFSRLPKPNITEKFLDQGEIAKIASEMIERMLNIYLNDSDAEDTIGKCRDDYLICGRGVARVIIDADDIVETDDGEELASNDQKIRIQYVPWKNFTMSTDVEWRDVRWIAFRHYMTRDDLVEKFGKIGKKVSLNKTRYEYNDKSQEESELYKLAEVWEIWDKEEREVIFATIGGDGVLLSKDKDTYNLKDFFPIPMPLGSKSNPCSLLPIPLYRLYKSQAEELNVVDKRIRSLIQQCKVTGVYNSISEQEDIKSIMNGEDGSFAPLKTTGGMQKVSDLVLFKPLDSIIVAIRELQQHKIEIINTIRDITGISDIIRGVSVASETATAQELKGNFAISRIQPLQKEVEFWSRDLLRLLVELTVEHTPIDQLVKMTNLKIVDILKITKEVSDRQRVLLMEGMKQIDSNDPQAQEKVAFLQEQAKIGLEETITPFVEILKGYAATPEQLQEVKKIIKDDKLRTFSIDIETDSTIRIDQQQEKQNRIEYITAISNFSSAFFPMVQAGIITKETFNQFMIFVSKPFKVGRNVEECLDTRNQPKQKEQPNAQEMLAQAQIQLEQQRLQLETQKAQIEAELKQQEINIKKAEQLFKMEEHKDNLEFEDVNRQADREAKRLDMIIKARTEVLNDQIRQANQPTEI